MNRKTKLFFRSFIISSVVVSLIGFGFFGITKAYEGIRLIGFGENRSAVFYNDGTLYLFDYKLKL